MRVRKRGGFDGGDRAAAQGNGEGDGLQRPAGLAMGSADPHMLRLDDDRVVRWRMEEGRWWFLERWQGRCWWRWRRRWRHRRQSLTAATVSSHRRLLARWLMRVSSRSAQSHAIGKSAGRCESDARHVTRGHGQSKGVSLATPLHGEPVLLRPCPCSCPHGGSWSLGDARNSRDAGWSGQSRKPCTTHVTSTPLRRHRPRPPKIEEPWVLWVRVRQAEP